MWNCQWCDLIEICMDEIFFFFSAKKRDLSLRCYEAISLESVSAFDESNCSQTEFTKIYSNYIKCVNRHLNQTGGGNEKFVCYYLYIVRLTRIRMQWFKESFWDSFFFASFCSFEQKQFIILYALQIAFFECGSNTIILIIHNNNNR